MSKHAPATPVIDAPETPAETAIVLAGTSAVALADQIDYEADAGDGLETIQAGDKALPFLVLLQKGSPQVDEDNTAKFISGAKPGDVLNTATGKIIPGANFKFVLCAYQRKLVEWVPRDSGGGYVATHELDGPAAKAAVKQIVEKNGKKRTKLITVAGNDLIETVYFFGIAVVGPNAFMSLISLTSSQLTPARNLITAVDDIREPSKSKPGTFFKPAMYSRLWTVSSRKKVGDQYTWSLWNFGIPAGATEAEKLEDLGLYNAAKAFSKDVREHKVNVAAPPSDDAAPESGEREREAPFSEDGKEVLF